MASVIRHGYASSDRARAYCSISPFVWLVPPPRPPTAYIPASATARSYQRLRNRCVESMTQGAGDVGATRSAGALAQVSSLMGKVATRDCNVAQSGLARMTVTVQLAEDRGVVSGLQHMA